MGELEGDLILGCADGALVIYDVKSRPRNTIAIVGGIHVTDTKSGLTPEGLRERRWVALNNAEPITHIFEYLPCTPKNGASDIDSMFDLPSDQTQSNTNAKHLGSIIASSVDGMVYLLKYSDKSLLHRFNFSFTQVIEYTIPLVSHGGNIVSVALG